jgi:hypothetical protein
LSLSPNSTSPAWLGWLKFDILLGVLRQCLRPIALAATLTAIFLMTSMNSAGQEAAGAAKGGKAAVKSAPTPRTAEGKVDFSGIWSPDRNFIYDIQDALTPGEKLPLQPWALKTAQERMSKDDPEALCLPTGVPRQAPYPWRTVQAPTHLFFLFEGNIHSYRQIFLDGRKHPDDVNPTWYGDSTAKWEGDTLVVDTIGLNDKFWFDFAGHPHTEKLHVIERFRRPDFDTLLYDVTIDDAGAYTKAFVMHGKSRYQQKEELMEFICNENNKDVEHIIGKDPRNHYAAEPQPGVPATATGVR